MKGKRYKQSSFELAEMASASAALHTHGHHPITAEHSALLPEGSHWAGEASSLAVECLLAWPYIRPCFSPSVWSGEGYTQNLYFKKKNSCLKSWGHQSLRSFFFKMPCDKTRLQISFGLECSAFL